MKTLKHLLWIVLVASGVARAQVAVVGSITTHNTSGTLISYSYTVPGGTNVLRLDETNAGFSNNAVAPTSCTYNGVPLTKAIGVTDVGPSTESSIWYLVSPPTGSSLTLACMYPLSTSEIVVAPVPLSGVNTSAPVGTGASASGVFTSPTNPAVTASGGSTNDLYACVASSSQPTTFNSTGTQTSIWNQTTAGYGSGGGTIPGSSSGACTWNTATAANDWTAVAIAFKATGAGPTSFNQMFLGR